MLRLGIKEIIEKNYNSFVKEYGSPLYMVDESHIEGTYINFRDSFVKYYDNVKVSYSVKTNYQPWVCKKLFELGAYPEIICGFELDIVEKLGYLNENVIVNGPVKTDEELERVIVAGAYLNVDNYHELHRIDAIAKGLNKTVEIGIRLNTKIDAKDWTRFGFNLESGDAFNTAVAISEKFKNIKLVGVHTHLGTSILDVEKYATAARRINKFVTELNDSSLIDLKYIDMGGGFPSSPRLNHYSEDVWKVPPIQNFAKRIVEELQTLLNRYKPILFLEPGRALISEPIHLLTKVLSAQKGKIIVDSGKNILPSVLFIEHEIVNLSATNTNDKEEYKIYGSLCMNSDVIQNNSRLSVVKERDVLLVENVGAYAFSQSMNFIRYQPAWVVLSKNNQVKLIRKRQDIDSLTNLDIL